MKYLITFKYDEHAPFYTNWFTPENNFVNGMVVFNLLAGEYTEDGYKWKEVEQDHL